MDGFMAKHCQLWNSRNFDEFRDAVYGGYDFRQLPDFGEILHNNIHDWFCVEDNFCIWEELQTMMSIQKPAVAEHSEDRVQDNPFVGKTIVVTGKVEPYTRDGIQHLYDKKALAAVLRQFLLHSEYNGYEINRLKETFYSKEELEDERRAEAERKKQEKRLEQEKRTIQKREKLQQLYNGSAESLVKFIGGYYHQDEKNEVLNMAFDKLVEWPVGCVRTMEAKGAHAFFELCGELVKSEPRPRHEILNMVLTLIGGEAA